MWICNPGHFTNAYLNPITNPRQLEIPDKITVYELKKEDLPEAWDSKPPILETQFIGDDFVNENNAAVLKVPGSIVPQEFNYLINPQHPDAKKIKVVSVTPFQFDVRLKTIKNQKE